MPTGVYDRTTKRKSTKPEFGACRKCGYEYKSLAERRSHARDVHGVRFGAKSGPTSARNGNGPVEVLAARPVPALVSERFGINVCPNCGCPLQGVRHGLQTELIHKGAA
jgi:hypothetical protein